MSAPDAAALEAAVRAEDAKAVRELLADATETSRRALAKALKPLLTGPTWEPPQPVVFTSLGDGVAFIRSQMAAQMSGEQPESSPAERERRDWWELRQTPAFAAFAVGVAGGRAAAQRALEECHGHHWDVSAADWAVIACVLADRNPPWLAELVDAGLSGGMMSLRSGIWPLARTLVRIGAMDRPANPDYAVAMVRGLTQSPPLSGPLPRRGGERMPEPTGTGGDLLARAILADPGLLEHEIWRLFTDPGVGKEMEQRIAWGYLRLGDQWIDALLELAEAGHLDRGRLLDECLDAFLRDFPPNHVAWYADLHDGLEPSQDEAAERSARYLALLAARSKHGLSLGQRMCTALLAAKGPGRALDPAAFLAASGPALLFPQKSVAMAQLKLVSGCVPGWPGTHGGRAADDALRDAALATAAQAFAHQRQDVQAAALKLLARHGLPAGAAARADVTALTAALSPALLPDAAALGLVPAAPVTAKPAGRPVTALGETGGQQHETVAAAPVAQVTGTAELVQLLVRLMEDASDTLAVERAMAGAVRLSGLPLSSRAQATRPLLRRARRQVRDEPGGPFTGYSIHADVAWLTLTWATGELPPPSMMEHLGWHEQGHDIPWQARQPEILSAVLSARIGEACTLIAGGRPLPLLAEPEFADGTIRPAELTARQAVWAAAEISPGRHDLEAARLRAGLELDGGLAFEPFVALTKVRSRTLPWGEKQEFTEDGPGVHARLGRVPSAPALRCWSLLTNLEHPLDDRRHAVHHTGVRLDEMVASWPLICPHHPELIAAHLLSPLSDGLGPGRNAAVAALRGLASLTGEFGKISHLALVTGLSGSAADVRIAAADAWALLAMQGRLDPSLAAESIGFGVTGCVLKLSRIADGLRHAAPEPAAAQAIARTCLLATAALLPARPAGLHLLLELAAQAGAASVMPEIPAPIAALAGGRGSSKLADAARSLIRLTR